MVFKEIAKEIIKRMNKYKPYLDSIVDPALIIAGANAGMLYWLFKIGESDLNNPTKVLAIGAGTLADFYFNKKAVWPAAKKMRDIDLKKVQTGLEAKLGSWLKTVLLATTITMTAPYVGKNVKHIIYEAIMPNAEELIYKGIDVSNIKLAEMETYIGRIQRTERWKYLTDKYEKEYGLPPLTLYSIIMEESYGDPTCINKRDGGVGLIHVQPAKAKEMGLKVYQDCNAISSKKHGEELHKLIIRLNSNLDSLKTYDDRFNNEKLIAKIAEQIAKYYNKFGNWNDAIAAINTGPNGVYDKKGNFTARAKRYINRINKWKYVRNNKKIIAKANKDFNKRNYEKGLTFEEYIEWFKNGDNSKKDKTNLNSR